jgi:xanthine dehydrogenase accessory factor
VIDDRPAVLRALVAAIERREPVVQATVVATARSAPRHAGATMLVRADGTALGSVGGGELERRVIAAARDALGDGRPQLLRFELIDPRRGDPGVCGGEVMVYVEPHQPPATVYVVGCGHVGRAVAELAHWLGFRVVATDDRADQAVPELLPGADLVIAGPITRALEQAPVTSDTHVVLVNRNTSVDIDVLPVARHAGGDDGVIGSPAAGVSRLLAGRVPADQLDRVRTPVGLDLGAETPREIALSILAEILAHRSGRAKAE